MMRRSDVDSLKENTCNTLSFSLIALIMYKSLIVDSGASHHMISDTRLIKNIEHVADHYKW